MRRRNGQHFEFEEYDVMKMWKLVVPVATVLLLAGQAAAQTDDEERQRYEEEREQAAMESMRAAEAREMEMEEKLRAAEERMEAAAREIAEITKERLPRIIEIEQRYAMSNKPRLGVTIESSDESGPVEGVTILGVSPGSAASEAGLRSGDILTSVNDEALSADSCKAANMRLLDFLKGVEEGDVLRVEYLRNGKVGSVEVEPRVIADNKFIWLGDRGSKELHAMPAPAVPPEMIGRFDMQFGLPWVESGLGDLELVELNEGLGRYFGTDKGLLVVKAPDSDAFELRDGDVIQSIDGREPKDVRHALRILGSYQAGEKLELGIMRDKKRIKVDVEIPADYHGNLQDVIEIEVLPAAAPVTTIIEPVPAAAPAPTVIVEVGS
jgi:C-terminal processing protease CtpA/Prc